MKINDSCNINAILQTLCTFSNCVQSHFETLCTKEKETNKYYTVDWNLDVYFITTYIIIFHVKDLNYLLFV